MRAKKKRSQQQCETRDKTFTLILIYREHVCDNWPNNEKCDVVLRQTKCASVVSIFFSGVTSEMNTWRALRFISPQKNKHNLQRKWKHKQQINLFSLIWIQEQHFSQRHKATEDTQKEQAKRE